jgi:hypothetical protein
MLLSLASVVGLQGVGAPATAAAPRIVHVSGTTSLADAQVVDFGPRGRHCVLRVDQVVAYEGDLEGTLTTTRPSEIRYFATCAEVEAAGFTGIPSAFNSTGHFVGTDGNETTMRSFGATDAAGHYEGITVAHGDLNGILHVSASPTPGSPPFATYNGSLVVND